MACCRSVLVVLVLASPLVVLASPVAAWNEPDAFRGVPWGASEEVLKTHIPVTCFGSKGSYFGERTCSSGFSIGDVPVKALLWLRSGGFVGVSFNFDPRRFSTIEAAFKERYGAPTRTEEEQGKPRGGLEFVNTIHEWHGSKVYISPRKYAGKIAESSATIQTATEREESWAVLGAPGHAREAHHRITAIKVRSPDASAQKFCAAPALAGEIQGEGSSNFVSDCLLHYKGKGSRRSLITPCSALAPLERGG